MTTPDTAERIEHQFHAIERWEPDVRALVGYDLEAARRRGRDSARQGGPLAGWSFAVKDIIDLEGVATKCNVEFLSAAPAQRHASMVQALLDAGAFWTAKTVTTTFAYFDPGPTRNPWNLEHTPGGSSSGSAAAVACGMVRLALGTQTVASINRPASYCGVVGFKPTFGRLPIEGTFPFAPSADTMGFFTPCVDDVRTAFSAVGGGTDSAAPNVLRVGVCTDMRCAGPEPSIQHAVQSAGARLANLGHHVGKVSMPEPVRDAYDHHGSLVAAEAALSHQNLFDRHRDSYPTKMRALIERGRIIDQDELDRIQSHRKLTMEHVERVFDRFDVILTPSAPGPAPRFEEGTGDPRMSLVWTYTGCPTITLPIALDGDGLPLGVQVAARRGEDDALIAAALTVERALDFRSHPRLPIGEADPGV